MFYHVLRISVLSLLTIQCRSHVHNSHNGHLRRNSEEQILVHDVSAVNGIMFQGFEWYVMKDTHHWNRLNCQLEKLAAIGVDRIWIPPATKANVMNSTGYDVYDLWDLGEFDAKGSIATSYGTKAELAHLSINAAAHGISIIADAVLNQRSGADVAAACLAHKVNPDNRLEITSDTQTISAWVNFSFPARNGNYSNKTWSCADFTAVDFDDLSTEVAIWKIEADNNDFTADVSSENGNYDYLILADVAYANPSVREDVKAWGAWMVDELGLGGFRLDAAKHISQAFLLDWVTSVEAKTGRTDLLFIAEYLTGDPTVVADFTKSLNNSVSTFDTPLQINFHDLSIGAQTNLSAVFDSTWLSIRPNQAVTYVTNHDTQVGQALDGLHVQGWFTPLAYALILLRVAGYPCLFYGDLYGTYDEFGWFTAPPYATIIADLALARKHFAFGPQSDYLDSTTTIGWTRHGDQNHPDGLAVIMSNEQGFNDQSKTMNVGSQHAGETWASIFGGEGQVIIDEVGCAEFVVGPGTVNVFTRADAVARENFNTWEFSNWGVQTN